MADTTKDHSMSCFLV